MLNSELLLCHPVSLPVLTALYTAFQSSKQLLFQVTKMHACSQGDMHFTASLKKNVQSVISKDYQHEKNQHLIVEECTNDQKNFSLAAIH